MKNLPFLFLLAIPAQAQTAQELIDKNLAARGGADRSVDGGNTWNRVPAGENGLPPGPYGRLEIEYAPSDARRVYAFIESPDSALFVSNDGGIH